MTSLLKVNNIVRIEVIQRQMYGANDRSTINTVCFYHIVSLLSSLYYLIIIGLCPSLCHLREPKILFPTVWSIVTYSVKILASFTTPLATSPAIFPFYILYAIIFHRKWILQELTMHFPSNPLILTWMFPTVNCIGVGMLSRDVLKSYSAGAPNLTLISTFSLQCYKSNEIDRIELWCFLFLKLVLLKILKKLR